MRVARWTSVLALAAATGLITGPVVTQQKAVVAHSVSVSDDGSTLELELTDGQRITFEVADGTLRINGQPAVSFKVGGEFESSWSNLLSHSGSLSSAELMEALKGWQLEGLEDMGHELGAAIEASLSNLDVVIASAVGAARTAAADVDAAEVALAIEEARRAQELVIDLNRLTGDQSVLQRVNELRNSYGNDLSNLGIQVENGRVHMGDLTIRRGQVVNGNIAVLSGDVSVYGTVNGNLAALNGDVILHNGARVEGDVIALNGRVTRAGGHVAGSVRSVGSLNVTPRRARAAPPAPTRIQVNQVSGFEAIGQGIATLLGFFVALACIGFGMNFFMPRQLEIVSETVSDSFGKSFMAGLFAQPLLLPLWAMLVVGLAITIVGLPVAVLVALALPLAVVGAAVTGYLAAAKSVGNSYLTRRMAQGHGVVVTPYRSTIYGLVGLLAVWAPAVALSWIPLIGQLLLTLALAATWVMATAGVGAALLSRAGLRATFAGSRKQPALTDEHYWPMDASNFTPARRGRPRR